MPTASRFRFAAVALLAAGALALAGCSGTSGTASTASGPSKSDPVTVQAGFIPVIDVAALYLGEEKGFFSDEGITLKINTGASGAALVPSVVSGEYQFAFSNMVSLLQARDKGLPIKVIAAGSSSTGVEGQDVTMIHAGKDSGITSAKDLEGKTVSVNALGNLLQMLGDVAVDKAGGDSSKVKFIELAFPDALAALQSGKIDAMVGAEPFGTAAIAAGFPAIASPYLDMSSGSILTSAYYTSEDQLAKNPALFKNLGVAIAKSLDYAQAHPDEVRAQLTKYTTLKADVAAKVILPHYGSDIPDASVKLFSDYALKYKLISKAVSPSDLVASTK